MNDRYSQIAKEICSEQELHPIKIGQLDLRLTHEEIRQAFIACGKILLEKEEWAQLIFEEEPK